MGRPRKVREDAPKPKTAEEIRDDAVREAEDRAAEAQELATTARLLGGQVPGQGEGLDGVPPTDNIESDDSIRALKGSGRIYPRMKIDGREVLLPPYDRSTVDEDGFTIFRDYGDGEYRLIVHNEHGYDFTVNWRMVKGFGEGRLKAKQEAKQPQGTDPAIVEMLSRMEERLTKADERADQLQAELREQTRAHSTETMRIFEKILDNKSAAPVAPAVDPVETLTRTIEQLQTLGLIPKAGEQGYRESKSLKDQLEEITGVAEILGMAKGDKDWKAEAVGLIKDALITLGPGVAAQLKAGAATRAAKAEQDRLDAARRRQAQSGGKVVGPAAPGAAPATGETVPPAVDPAPEGEPKPEPEGGAVNLLDMSVWQFMLAKAMKNFPDKCKGYTDRLLGMAREKKDPALSAQEIVDAIKAEAVDAAGVINKEQADIYVSKLFDFAEDEEAVKHLDWASREMGVTPEEVAVNSPWFQTLIDALLVLQEQWIKEAAEEDDDDDDDEGDD